MTKEEIYREDLYREYRRYGKILKSEDFEFSDEGIFVTMIVMSLDGYSNKLFILRNNKVVHMEDIN